jgi:hypothetical protein
MRRFLIAAFSMGWLLPMWAAGSTVLDFLQVEAWPLWRGEHPVNSFPFIQFASQAFAIGSVWLAAVIAWWAWRLAGRPEAPPIGGDSSDAMGSR